MRQFTIGILCSAAFLATAGCNKSPQGQGPEAVNAGAETAAAATEYFTVRPGPVAPANIAALAGTFQMLKVSAAQGIPSGGRGGACLTFRAADLGFTEMAKAVCSTNVQCSHAPPAGLTPSDPENYSFAPDPANPSHRENRFGYCDRSSHQCWSKPISNGGNDKVCNRPITMTPATLNPVPTAPINVSEWVGKGAKVRVVACLQKTGAKPGPDSVGGTGCPTIDGHDRIEVMGPEANL